MTTFPVFEWLCSRSVVERLGWVLVHSLWQFALVALLAAVTVRAMRRSSSALRHGVLVVAMAMLVAAPVATWLLQPSDRPAPLESRVTSVPEPSSIDPESDALRPAGDLVLSDSTRDDGPTPDLVVPSAAFAMQPTVTLLETSDALREQSWLEWGRAALRPWLAWIVTAWSLGVVLCSARPLLGWRTLRRLRRVGVSAVSDEVLAAMQRVSTRLGLRRAVQVFQSTLAQVPIVVGYARPVILLPVSLLTSIPVVQLEAILAHELAHVRRHDFLMNLLQTLVETLFFYHPAMWWLSGQIRVEREHCCDDLVVKLLGNRVEYGRALVAVEQLRGRHAALALGATDGSLLARVRRIVGFNSDRAAVRLRDRLPVALVGLACLGVALVLSMSWSLAAKDENAKDPQRTAVGPQPELVQQIADKPNVPEPKIDDATAQPADRAAAKFDDAAQAKIPSLEFRIAANVPEDGWEPVLPEDWEQRNYRDGRLPVGKDHEAGFVWYPLSQPWRSDAAFVVSKSTPGSATQGNELLHLLSDQPEQGMLMDGSWRVLQAKVVPGKRNPAPGEELGYAINVRLDDAGQKRFAELASSFRDMSLAVVMNSEIVGKLLLKEPSARLEFGGHFTKDWAEELARQLNGLPSDPLAAQIRIYASSVTLQETFEKLLPVIAQRAGRKLSVDFDALKAAGVPLSKIVTIPVRDESLRQALERVLNESDVKLDYRLSDDGQELIVFAPPSQIPASAPPKGLEFLKPYPKLHGLSLDMTEKQFLEIVKQQELSWRVLVSRDGVLAQIDKQPDWKTFKTIESDKVTHHIALGDGHTLIVTFDKDAKCSGIQRVRGENENDVPNPVGAIQGAIISIDQQRGLAVISVGADDAVKRLMRFEVRVAAPARDKADRPIVKGKVEVIRVGQDRSDVRILNDDATNQITKGDEVISVDEDGGAQPAQPEQQPDKSDQERMVGNWFIINDDSLRKGEMWLIDEDRILMNPMHGGLNANLYFHRLDAGQDPKQIDITVTLVNGPPVGVIKGIYRLDGDELRLCLGALAKDRPAAFPEQPGPDELLILHRQKPSAGLPESAPPTKTADNANGDLRSNPAAGSGDPRQAQDKSDGPPELRTLREPSFRLPGHSNITGIGFDNNSTELVAISTYHFATIRRWDLVGMKLKSDVMLSSDRHLRPFREGSFKLSGDGRRVIAATDEYVGIWETTTGQLLKKLPFPTREGIYDCWINNLDCTPDLSVIAGNWAMPGRLTLFYDARVMIWDGNSGNLLQTVIVKNGTDLKSIDLSSDGKLLATTNGGGAKVWETSSGKLLRSFPNDNKGRKHSDPEVSHDATHNVWCVQLSPDGKQVAMGDILGVKLLDVASGKLLQLLERPHRYGLGTLVFSKDGQLLARTGTGDRVEGDKSHYVVPIWSTQTGEKLFELHTESNAGAFSDDNKQFAVGVSDWEMALAVFQLSGSAANTTQLAPESTKDKVAVGTHCRGQEAEEFIDNWKPVWGEPQLGIRYGIALTTPQRQFRVGERVPLVVFFRNASNKPLQIDTRPDFFGNTPKLVDAKGVMVGFEKIPLLGGSTCRYVENLEPGEAVGPLYLNFGLGENPRPGQQNWTPYWKTPGTDKYKLTHSVSIKVAGPEAKPDAASNEWKSGDLATGTIEFEIVDVGKAENKKEEPSESNAVLERPSPLEFRVAVNPADGNAGPRVPVDFLKRHYPDNTPQGRAAAKDRGFIWIPIAKPRDGGVILPMEATRGELRIALLGDTTDTAFLLDGSRRVVHCQAVPDQNQPDSGWSIQVTLDEAAGAAFRRLTQSHLNQQIAIIVDGAIVAAPKIRSEIGTEVAITGNFSRDEAEKLIAVILSHNEPGDQPKPTDEGGKTEDKQEEPPKPNASVELQAIDPNGEIVGQLVHDATGEPVEGATVACGAVINDSGNGGGANAVTDAEGRYRMPVPSPGIYNVWLKKYETDAAMTAAADDGILVDAGKVASSELRLIVGRKVTGKVVDSDGKLYADMGVSCYSPARPFSGGVQSVKTKADGTFEFALPPGRAYVYTHEPTRKTNENPFGVGRSASVHVDVPEAGDTPPITLTLQKHEPKFGDSEWLKTSTPGTQIVRREGNEDVTGIVVDEAGQPIADAKVFRYDGPLISTNEKGEFHVKALKGTQFVMYTFVPGYHVWTGSPTSGDVLKIVMERKTRSQRTAKNDAAGTNNHSSASRTVVAATREVPAEAESPSQDAVTSAISRGVAYLKSQQREDGSWPESESQPSGVTALVTAALLQAGTKAEEPSIQKALAYLRKTEPTFIYSVALQIMVFSAASPQDDAALIRKHVAWIENAQVTAGDGTSQGGWSYHAHPVARADGSCTRFALLGLHAAQTAGFPVKRETWERSAGYWLATQKPDGRWGYTSAAPATSSMTLAGIGGLATANSFLPTETAREAALRRAWEAIANNIPSLTESSWPFYSLYCLERAGHLSNTDQFGTVVWKSGVMNNLIDSQRQDGAWAANPPSAESPLIAASFALLVLTGQPISDPKK